MQPSYLNWKENDLQTKKAIVAALKTKSSKYIRDQHDLTNWIKGLHPDVVFNGPYHFTRQVQRNMSDGSRIQFIWNKSDQWQTLSLTLGKTYKTSCWMNAEDGTVINNNSSAIAYRMPPYGAVILYASTKNNNVKNTPMTAPLANDQAKALLSLGQWDVKADTVTIRNSSLFDWKTNDQLKFSSAEGVYTSSFQWNNANSASHFYLDLGKVYFTAEVYVNGKPAGKRIFAPYQLEITPLLVQGLNKIEVHVTTGQLNSLIGKAKQGDSHYKQFKGKEDQVVSAGLIGPVMIREIKSENK
jgi:hypothetical protein